MTLLALQRDFRSWLTTEATDAMERLAPTGSPGPSVYLNNYRASLMACLSESFEKTRAWLGDEAFEAACARHVDRSPPSSWTLDAYGQGLPATLADIYPDDPEVAELARLESALGVAFVGADAAPIDPSSLADVDWDAAAIDFVPALVTLDATTNAGAIWSALDAGDHPPGAERLVEPAAIAVWRNGLHPAFRTLGDDEAVALLAAIAGRTFGEICAELVDRRGEEVGTRMAGAILGQWLQDGVIRTIG